MQNAERRIKNEETANFSILHSAFCVLHSNEFKHRVLSNHQHNLSSTCPSASRSIRQPRVPIAATIRRVIEYVPQRPDQIDVTKILSLLFGRVQQFRAVEMMNAPISSHEHIQRRQLPPIGLLGVIVVVVSVI